MAGQKESNIADFAFEYLQGYYSVQHSTKTMLVSRAEMTKQGAAADGLFAFKNPDGTLFVASLFFRDSPALARILTTYKKRGLSRLRYVSALFLFAAAFAGSKPVAGNLLIPLALALPAALAGFVLHSLAEKRYLKGKMIRLLDAFKKYPANEQWLGISISSLCFRNNSLAAYLLQTCRRRGIGLLTVGKRAKVVLMQEPSTHTCRRGDFLSYYSAEQSIRKALQDNNMLRVA